MSRTISERLFRLKQLRRSMEKDLGSLGVEIAALERELRSAGFKPRKEVPRPNAARLNEMTVADAAAKVLGRPGRSMQLTEIVREIEQKGLYRTQSSHLRSTVAQALMRDARFRRVGRGTYRLGG